MINDYVFITSKDNVFPEVKMVAFNELMEVPQQISITSDFLNQVFGIDDIVIKSFSSRQIEGTRNQVAISFECLSDVALEVNVLE